MKTIKAPHSIDYQPTKRIHKQTSSSIDSFDAHEKLKRHREIMAEYYDLFFPSPLGPTSAPTRNHFPWLAED